MRHPLWRLPAYLSGLAALALATGCAPAAGGPAATSVAVPSFPATTLEPSTTASEGPSTTPTETAEHASAVETPSAAPTTAASLLDAGATGEQVRELQARLKQLKWYDGEVTGSYADSTASGVRGFQNDRGLATTGALDQETWNQLVSRTRTPTEQELTNRIVAGPALFAAGATGARVRDLQARLKQIGWWSGDVTDTYGPATVTAVQQFQAKRGIPVTGEVDQRTLDRLNAMTRQPSADELQNVKPTQAPQAAATGLDPRCLTGRVLCVSKRTNRLVWVVDGVAGASVDVRFGSQELPTREGVFSVFAKSRDHVSTLYHTPMPYAMFFSGGQAVHYSPDFAARGYRGASHGCVNVRDLRTIASLFDQVRIGDSVIVSG